ncbi:MAG: Signal peptidase-like protein [Cyclobacteriaceae bacterium]|nr:Signal peptidase-like protein [Cyclobacteriaceae bacterium]
MSCACSTTSSKTAGCNSHGGCSTGGCNRLNVFDWLSNMEVPLQDRFDIVEVRFKNGRKDFYRNSERLTLHTGDAIVLEAQNGHHLGHVSMQGELVRLQMRKKNVANDGEIRKIYRLAHQKDIEKFDEARKRETPTLHRSREIIKQLNLQMKLSDVEYQADNSKATFFYSAEDRVDFRELIKLLAGEFRVRVEMRQISLRQEAGRIGGIGVCGRELCCSTWLTDFKNVATSAARYQNLSLNPAKLSGQCGRLKCCLNYELETYMEALQHIPKVEGPLHTEKGDALLQKTDIFRRIMWFGFKDDTNWYPIDVARVNEIIELNREGRKPASLEENESVEKDVDGPLNSDLDKLDKKYKNKGKGRRNRGRNRGRDGKEPRDQQQQGPRKPNQGNPNQGNPNQGNPNQSKPNQGKPNQGRPNQGRPNQGKPNQNPNQPNRPPQS